MKSLRAVWALLAVFLLACTLAGCGSGGSAGSGLLGGGVTATTGSLAGTVRVVGLDGATTGLAGAEITVSGPTHAQTESTSTGTWQIGNLAPGAYSVTVTSPAAQSGTVYVASTATTLDSMVVAGVPTVHVDVQFAQLPGLPQF